MVSDLRVHQISEAELLQVILPRLKAAKSTIIGPGDDCAVLETGARTVATIDTLVEGPDFHQAWSDGFSLGWKSAAVNLADVAAMGAKPTALLVALTVPGECKVSYLADLADGLQAACEALAPGCAVVGGDLATSNTLTVAVTALGQMKPGLDPVTRSGAKPGDLITIAGSLGAAANGLQILFNKFRDADAEPIPLDLALLGEAERSDVLVQLRPSPPISQGEIAALAGASAMMDLSDGLGIDARRLAAASGVSLDFSSDLLAGFERPIGALMSAGEDHSLLTTFAPSAVIPAGFVIVGEVLASAEPQVLLDGVPFLDRGGWDPYLDAQ